jgi:ABC-type amino acid transport substrate-binding protein
MTLSQEMFGTVLCAPKGHEKLGEGFDRLTTGMQTGFTGRRFASLDIKVVPMKLFPFFYALLFATIAEGAWPSDGPTRSQRWEAAPTGKLRVGVVSAPSQSAFFVVKDARGEPRGVTVDLGKELARQLGVPVEFIVVSSSGELGDALSVAAIDVAFMPIDAERRKRVDFGPTYFIIESTYIVRPGSDITSLSNVDRPNIRDRYRANAGAGRYPRLNARQHLQAYESAPQRRRSSRRFVHLDHLAAGDNRGSLDRSCANENS